MAPSARRQAFRYRGAMVISVRAQPRWRTGSTATSYLGGELCLHECSPPAGVDLLPGGSTPTVDRAQPRRGRRRAEVRATSTASPISCGRSKPAGGRLAAQPHSGFIVDGDDLGAAQRAVDGRIVLLSAARRVDALLLSAVRRTAVASRRSPWRFGRGRARGNLGDNILLKSRRLRVRCAGRQRVEQHGSHPGRQPVTGRTRSD